MSSSSKNKLRRAVLVSIDEENGEYRLRLDDVHQGESPLDWKQAEHCTSKLIPKEFLEDLSFDDKYLADFGYTIMARLYAFMKRGEL